MDVFYIKLACLRAFLTVNTVFCFMVIVLIIPKCVVCLTRSSNSCTETWHQKDFFCNCNYATFSPPDVFFFFFFFLLEWVLKCFCKFHFCIFIFRLEMTWTGTRNLLFKISLRMS